MSEPAGARWPRRVFCTEVVPNLRESSECGYRQAVDPNAFRAGFSTPPLTSCAVAAGLALWQRDVVAPAAARHLGQAVTRIELGGPAYACRRCGRAQRIGG